MGRAVAHALDHATGDLFAGVRPKPIDRTTIAARLSLVVQATGTKAALAARLGVDDAIVRRLCSGAAPITVERMVAAGRAGAAVLRLAAEEAYPVARRGASPERHVLSITRYAGAVAAEVESTESSVARTLGRALELRDAADALIADLGGA